MWNRFQQIEKFTAKAQLDQLIGKPLFQLEDRPAYYYGGGFVVYYTPRRFRVEGIQRVEYGEPGEYAVGLHHYSTAAALKTGFGLSVFDADDVAPLEGEIVDGLSYASTFDDAYRWAARHPWEYCQRGETQRLVDGRMEFLYRYIECGAYKLYFYGKPKKTKLTGFQFVFDE